MANRKDTGAAGDPFAPWRGLSEFTLEDAAHLCAGIVPGRGFRSLRDRDRAEQEALAALAGWRKRLHDIAPELGVETRLVPERKNYSTDFDGRLHVSTTPAHKEYGNVARAALVEWLDKQGKRPAFFDDGPTERPVAELERGTLLILIGVLAELAGFDLRKSNKRFAEAQELLPEIARRSAGADGRAARGEEPAGVSRETVAGKLCDASERIVAKGPGRMTEASRHSKGTAADSNSNGKKP